MAETQFSVPQGDFDIIRYPPTRDQNLRAWDAADELLLAHVAEVLTEGSFRLVVTVNDAFGALTVAVRAAGLADPTNQVRFVSDSHVASIAIRQNLDRNGFASPDIDDVGDADMVLIKVPKTLGLLELQLHELRASLRPTTVILAGGMTRDIHSSTIDLFERIIGPTRTSHAKKKARLIFSDFDPERSPEAPQPTVFPLGLQDVQLINYPGIFSAKRIDNGTRLLLEKLPLTSGSPDVIDLGCGNGALGVAIALANPDAHVTFIDESHLAVRSAEATFTGAFAALDDGGAPRAKFRVGDCLDGLHGDSADLIVCNPPFHQGRVQIDDVAWKMFTGAKRVLRPSGEMFVVGNRHLEYFDKLGRAFGNSQVVASNSGFVVVRAVA